MNIPGSPKSMAMLAVLNKFWPGCRVWDLGVRFLSLFIRASLSHSRGPLAGHACERQEGSAVSGAILAEHFPGMLAPSAQAENFASANCDFRTQVCS